MWRTKKKKERWEGSKFICGKETILQPWKVPKVKQMLNMKQPKLV